MKEISIPIREASERFMGYLERRLKRKDDNHAKVREKPPHGIYSADGCFTGLVVNFGPAVEIEDSVAKRIIAMVGGVNGNAVYLYDCDGGLLETNLVVYGKHDLVEIVDEKIIDTGYNFPDYPSQKSYSFIPLEDKKIKLG